MTPTDTALEKAFLAGLSPALRADEEVEESLKELASLAATAGAEVAGQTIQRRPHPDPATYLGSGKTVEIRRAVEELGCDLVIVDDELKPSQANNLQEAVGCKVLDRTQLILDVFAQRARTNEGKLQVELAQLTYLLPRLTGHRTELSRLGGGIGTRGPGETKLETDRRRIRDHIVQLKREIDHITTTRSLQRESRRSQHAVLAALAGYTNAGKSSLFNALTGSEVLVQDRLFSTLDPTIRPLLAGEKGQDLPVNVLLADTVGFIHKLPHTLVAAFRATLEEVAEADLRLQVADASSPRMEERRRTVEEVLAEILKNSGGQARGEDWLVLNKSDLLSEETRKTLSQKYPEASLVSAKTGEGLQELKADLMEFFARKGRKLDLLLPAAEAGLLKKYYGQISVLKQAWIKDKLAVEITVPKEGDFSELERFVRTTEKKKRPRKG
jgi:GTP-binding protein HflX